MEGQGHIPPGTNLQKCDFCYATFSTLSELICHSCIHAPGNPQNRDLYQAQNFLTKANFNNPGFANLDDLARHNRLHPAIEKPTYNNFYDAPFTSSSQLNFTQQIPAAHQQIPPAHQQIPTIHQPIFPTDKAYSCNFRDATFAQQCAQAQNESGATAAEHLAFNPELFQGAPFTATKVPPAMAINKKPVLKETTGEPKPSAPRKKRTGTGERNHKCYLCGSAFLKRSHLVEHLPIHTGERPFKCDICGQTFIKKSDLARHNLTHTGEKPFKCEYCDAAYTRKSILRQHVLIHTNEKPFKCTSCIAAFNKKTDLTQHMLIHTGEKPYKCDTCDSAFTTKNQLKDHKATHTGEKLHKCILCGASFKRRKGLKRHHRIHTGKKPHKCEKCEAAFVEKSQLKVHMRIHTGEKPFKCDQCGAAFRQKGLLTIHQNIHQGLKQYQCDQCTASFSQKCNLTIHKRVHSGVDQFNQYLYQPSYTATRIQLNMLNKSRKMEINEATAKLLEELTPRPKKVHSGEKSHKCTFCDAAFSRKSYLTEHVAIHTGEKPYSCDMCDSSFSKKADLTRHRRIHSGDKPFKCRKCDASFIRKSNLTQHMYTHTIGKPYKCKFCTGIFTKKSDLEEHQVTHSGTATKNYVCETCDASFTSKSKLKEHKSLHNPSIKLFKCIICNAEFKKQSSLKRHNRTHTSKKTYTCETCNASFSEKKQLKQHLKTHLNSVKPYQCELCDASFAQKGQLKFHQKSHKGDKPYKCNICTASFSRKPSLVNHQIMHKRKAQEREYLELKSEPEEDMDTAVENNITIPDDEHDEPEASDTCMPESHHMPRVSKSPTSSKRKRKPTPRRRLPREIGGWSADEYIKEEVDEEDGRTVEDVDDDEDYPPEGQKEHLMKAEDEKLNKQVSDDDNYEEEEMEDDEDDDKTIDNDSFSDKVIENDTEIDRLDTLTPGQNFTNNVDTGRMEHDTGMNDNKDADGIKINHTGPPEHGLVEYIEAGSTHGIANTEVDRKLDKTGYEKVDFKNDSIRQINDAQKYRQQELTNHFGNVHNENSDANELMKYNQVGLVNQMGSTHVENGDGEGRLMRNDDLAYSNTQLEQKVHTPEGTYTVVQNIDYDSPDIGNGLPTASNMGSQKLAGSTWPTY